MLLRKNRGRSKLLVQLLVYWQTLFKRSSRCCKRFVMSLRSHSTIACCLYIHYAQKVADAPTQYHLTALQLHWYQSRIIHDTVHTCVGRRSFSCFVGFEGNVWPCDSAVLLSNGTPWLRVPKAKVS